MVRFNKQIAPRNYNHEEYQVEAVHDIIDVVLKCKDEWTCYEELTWGPSYRIKHADVYRELKMLTDRLFKKADKVAKRRNRKIYYEVEDIIARRVHEVHRYFV